MTLALFDLDNTLIAGDSDHLWGEWLADRGLVDGDDYRARNDRFYEDYQRGQLDVMAYLQFVLAPLAQHPPEQLQAWHAQFMQERILPIWLPLAEQLLEDHRRQGHTLVIVTATNDFITAPIARRLGVEHLIAPVAERRDGRYTGAVTGIPSFREGKVTRLRQWLAEQGGTLEGAWFYSDSLNDLPLLELVDHPVAVDPDPTLLATATERGWPVISLRSH